MNFLRSFYINPIFYFALLGVVTVFVLGFFMPEWMSVAKPIFFGVLLLLVMDTVILFANSDGISASRKTVDKLSNGDDNPISITVSSTYVYPVWVRIIEEMPFQFQERKMVFRMQLNGGEEATADYIVRPVKRGEYEWGAINVYVRSPLQLVSRRYRFDEGVIVPCYPSFLQMKKYQFLAISQRLQEAGVKKIRTASKATDFEQIRDYVPGDDIRSVNWKATARRDQIMVNQYEIERSQQIYSVIDMGRLMQMPFNGLSLLDYAINSTLVMSNIAMMKDDKAGVVCFSHEVHNVLKASKRSVQIQRVMEMLYAQKTRFLETDYQKLYAGLRTKIRTRSLMLIYTNFESITALRRQLPWFRRMSREHLLVVIFFENTELTDVINKQADTMEDVYNKIVAEKFSYEKRQILAEFRRYGIHALMSTPEDLTVNSINKYLELKARGSI